MKNLSGKFMMIGVNGIGALILLLLFGSLRVTGVLSVSWSLLFSLLGVSVFILSGLNLVVIFTQVFSPLARLKRFVHFSSQVERSANPLSGIQELRAFEQTLHAQHREFQSYRRLSETFLETGQLQADTTPQFQDEIGELIQRFIQILQGISDYVSVLIEGQLYCEIPDSIARTPFGQAFRRMTNELRTIILDLRQETSRLSAVGAQIAAMSQQGSRNATTATQEIETISSSIHEVAGNLREVLHNIRRQADSLEQTFVDIQELLNSTERINQSVELLSASAEATSRSIHEIHEFMQEIDRHAHSVADISETVSAEAKEGGKAVDKVITGIQTIKSTVEDAASTIRRLGEESGHIGEILEVINGVAEQTNLLALNASIIAAQAGEHGRGFSVVADEIKELADRTRTSTQEIGEIIRALQQEVHQGIVAMQRCLDAVDDGVVLANQSGEILGTIVQSIQGTREMATSLAEATVTQTKNSEQVHQATDQIIQKIEDLSQTAAQQTQGSTHLAEMANILKEVTQHIEGSANTQFQAADAIVIAIEEIQVLVHRNAETAHKLATSSEELGTLESNLAENMGHFLITPPPLPETFDASQPTVGFVFPGAPFFYGYIFEGLQEVLSAQGYQTLALDAQNDPILQAEYFNWLLRHPWLKGLVLCAFDEQTGGRIVLNAQEAGVPLIVVDRSTQHALLSVFSNNRQGGECAAELLHEILPGKVTVLACGPRNITSIFNRMEGFFQKARSYGWRVVEAFTTVMNVEGARQSIIAIIQRSPDIQAVFLTNEHASLAYLDLVKEGYFAQRQIAAVCYDINMEIAQAIRDGHIVGTIFQDPAQLGKAAGHKLLEIFRNPGLAVPDTPQEILTPVKKVTQNTVASYWPSSKN